MSRIGKKIITIPDKVEVKISADKIDVKGPLGSSTLVLMPNLKFSQKDNSIEIIREKEDNYTRSSHGLMNRLLTNAINGVVAGYQKELELIGVGYKVAMKGKNLELFIGFSHPVLFAPPAGIKIEVEKNIIKISGTDKQLVGETTAKIRGLKKPEPYKGKGLKYIDEQIRRKAGKMASSGA
ncbi:MAG: 50S ribosomal protein L6 [Patescibacteria group bacterium]